MCKKTAAYLRTQGKRGQIIGQRQFSNEKKNSTLASFVSKLHRSIV